MPPSKVLPFPPHSALSTRERMVFDMVIMGCRRKQIAHELDVTIHTVDRHIEHIRDKLQIRGTVAFVRYAVRHGLIEA